MQREFQRFTVTMRSFSFSLRIDNRIYTWVVSNPILPLNIYICVVLASVFKRVLVGLSFQSMDLIYNFCSKKSICVIFVSPYSKCRGQTFNWNSSTQLYDYSDALCSTTKIWFIAPNAVLSLTLGLISKGCHVNFRTWIWANEEADPPLNVLNTFSTHIFVKRTFETTDFSIEILFLLLLWVSFCLSLFPHLWFDHKNPNWTVKKLSKTSI